MNFFANFFSQIDSRKARLSGAKEPVAPAVGTDEEPEANGLARTNRRIAFFRKDGWMKRATSMNASRGATCLWK